MGVGAVGWGGAQAYAKAKGLLLDNRPALDALAKLLMEKETVPGPARPTATHLPDHPTTPPRLTLPQTVPGPPTTPLHSTPPHPTPQFALCMPCVWRLSLPRGGGGNTSPAAATPPHPPARGGRACSTRPSRA